jgi:predicted nucleic acid-binding protein
MSEPREKGPRRFVVDTNVFVAAIKPFSKVRRGTAQTETGSLSLLLKLINDDEFELFADAWLLDEYRRLGEELNSETSDLILSQLTRKTHAISELKSKVVARCRPYLPEGEAADVLHAAACLQAGAVLITNDKDFERIGDSGVIQVWSISEAIRNLSGESWGRRGRETH